jgi:hypothetical protein
MEYSGFGEGCRTQGYGGCDVALVRDAPIAEPPSIWILIAGLLAFPVASRLSANTRKRHQGPASIAGTLNAFSPPAARGAGA